MTEEVERKIEEWVASHLANSPVWGEEKWEAIGEILGVEFDRRAA